jgi:hypothetical protein
VAIRLSQLVSGKVIQGTDTAVLPWVLGCRQSIPIIVLSKLYQLSQSINVSVCEL